MKKIVCLLGCLVFVLCGGLFSGCSNGTALTPKEFVQQFLDFELPQDMEVIYTYKTKMNERYTVFRCIEEPTEMLENFAPPNEYDYMGEDAFAYNFITRLRLFDGEDKVPKITYPNFDENYLLFYSSRGKMRNGETYRGDMALAYFPSSMQLYTLGGFD